MSWYPWAIASAIGICVAPILFVVIINWPAQLGRGAHDG